MGDGTNTQCNSGRIRLAANNVRSSASRRFSYARARAAGDGRPRLILYYYDTMRVCVRERARALATAPGEFAATGAPDEIRIIIISEINSG